jgi:hypothetical protein
MNEFVIEVAAFFDDRANAAALIESHMMGDCIRLDDGTMVPLRDFYENHKRAYERRVARGTAHRLDILKLELEAPPVEVSLCSSSPAPESLESIEKRRSEPEYVYRPGRQKR